MKLVLVESGETTAVYHAFYKNKICTYKTLDGISGLMEAIGVEVTETRICDNPKDGKIVDSDGFPSHLDNLPSSTVKKSVKKRSTDTKKKYAKKKTK